MGRTLAPAPQAWSHFRPAAPQATHARPEKKSKARRDSVTRALPRGAGVSSSLVFSRSRWLGYTLWECSRKERTTRRRGFPDAQRSKPGEAMAVEPCFRSHTSPNASSGSYSAGPAGSLRCKIKFQPGFFCNAVSGGTQLFGGALDCQGVMWFSRVLKRCCSTFFNRFQKASHITRESWRSLMCA